MSSRSSVGGGNFWGLVQQKGPWKTTKADIANANQSIKNVSGGGIGEGGTVHAGHGNYKQIINPEVLNGRNAPPKPSRLAMRSIIIKPKNHYRKKAVAGMLPQYETLGERSAADVGGQKAGGMGAGDEMIDPLSDIEMMPSTPVIMPSASFLTEHRLEDEQVEEEKGIRMIPIHYGDKKGVVRKPKQKVFMKPYERVEPKESKNVQKVRALMAKREQEKLFAAPSGIPKRPAETQEEKRKKANIKQIPVFDRTKSFGLPSGLPKRPLESQGGKAKKGNIKQVPVFDRTKKFGRPSGLPKRKAETGGAGSRKKVKVPKLQITTTGLPPPVQRFQAPLGEEEKGSLPKSKDVLPRRAPRRKTTKK